MNFLNRLYFFSFGVGFGLLILYFSLKIRDGAISFDYFPNSRVKKKIIQSEIVYSKKALCKIDCYSIDTLLIDKYIMLSNVDFKKSKVRGYIEKTYYLSLKIPDLNPDNIYLVFHFANDMITLKDLHQDLEYGDLQLSRSSIDPCVSCFESF